VLPFVCSFSAHRIRPAPAPLTIPSQEFRAVLLDLGFQMTTLEFRKLMGMYDPNGDGISYTELLERMYAEQERIARHAKKEEAEEAQARRESVAELAEIRAQTDR
jgi:hypothetical protein